MRAPVRYPAHRQYRIECAISQAFCSAVRKNRNGSPVDPLCFGSWHPLGANFVLADGSCLFLNNSIDSQVFTALGTPNGGEAVNAESP